MADRRDYKTGSVYQRESDWRWIATIEAGWNANGKRRRVTVSANGCEGGCKPRCQHRAEIKRKLRDKGLAIEKGGLPVRGSRITVKQWSERWLELTKATLRPKPWATDASAVKKWIVPTIGNARLEELSPDDLRAVSRAQIKAGRSTTTARRTHLTLTAMLRAAMIEGYQVPPRVLLLKAPSVEASDRDEMPVAEVLLVLNAAVALLPHWSRWFVQAIHGMRPAEVLGVTWDAIDLNGGTLTVDWQLQALPYVDRKNKALGFRVPEGFEVRHLEGSYHLTRPKTKKGYRVIPLVPAMKRALLDWRELAPANPYGLVWPAANGRPAREKDDLDEWYRLQDTVGVRHPTRRDKNGEAAHYYIYEARHGFATRLLEEGADEHVITALMGHSSIVTSRGYMHVKQQQALEAMERVAARYILEPPT